MPLGLNRNLVYLFAAATVAGIRNRLHAKKAVRAGKLDLAGLLDALEASESAHTRRFLMYLRGKTSDTDTYLEDYQASKINDIAPRYADMAAQYAQDGQAGKAENLNQFKSVVTAQAQLLARYRNPDEALPKAVYTCRICGFVTTAKQEANCPVCNAVKEKFDRFGLSPAEGDATSHSG